MKKKGYIVDEEKKRKSIIMLKNYDENNIYTELLLL